MIAIVILTLLTVFVWLCIIGLSSQTQDNPTIRFVHTRKRLYIIARLGLCWIIETATPASGSTLPAQNDEKLLCTIFEGAPHWKSPWNRSKTVIAIQRKLSQTLTDGYKWIQVIEIV